MGNKYGYGSAINITAIDETSDTGVDAFTVQAGQLTLVDIDAESTDIREDKTDVILGKIKVTNIA
jgi:hypothetical protein